MEPVHGLDHGVQRNGAEPASRVESTAAPGTLRTVDLSALTPSKCSRNGVSWALRDAATRRRPATQVDMVVNMTTARPTGNRSGSHLKCKKIQCGGQGHPNGGFVRHRHHAEERQGGQPEHHHRTEEVPDPRRAELLGEEECGQHDQRGRYLDPLQAGIDGLGPSAVHPGNHRGVVTPGEPSTERIPRLAGV